MLSNSTTKRTPTKKSHSHNKKKLGDTHKRRLRTPWLDFEIQNLIIGVFNFGVGKWSIIHTHMNFNDNRTYIDLKDKWRNLIDHRNCSRTSILYRALASIIQREQLKHGHKKPEHVLTKDDWQWLLRIYSPQIEAEISNLSQTLNSSEISSSSDDSKPQPFIIPPLKSPNPQRVIFPPILNTIPIQETIKPVTHVNPLPIEPRKVPTFQDFLW